MTETTTDAANEARRVIRRTGRVASARMDKSIVVKVERLVRHPLYQKYVRKYTTLHAHDEANEANEGDLVEVVFTRPISKTKRWRLERVVRRAEVAP